MVFGLALGGGGARGAAHIGVLTELERLNLKPAVVTGTSIGGLVGALIAAGLDSAHIVEVFREMEFGHIYALPWFKPALTDNSKLEKLLVKAIGRPSFADLDIALGITATDLVSRELVILNEGDVVSAVLATTAFPVVLPPVIRDDRTLIDGGVLNNCPFDIAYQMGATRVLAVDLANSAPYGTEVPKTRDQNVLIRLLNRAQQEPLYQAVSAMADIITWQNVKAHLEDTPPDLLLRPDMSTIGLFDFHRLEDGIQTGREAVGEVAPTLEEWRTGS